ncbi:hypothetical protein EGI22_08875 [Lacihabitans sp. LS3-19]|nr:hypothetical protein [Lacihabitans sp. LS3-19]
MLEIGMVTEIVSANGQNALETVGISLLIAITIHNFGGYILGYFSAKTSKLNETKASAIAIEIGI